MRRARWIEYGMLLISLGFFTIALAQDEDNRIVFMSDRDGNREIYTMNSDGSAVERLTNNDAQDLQPAWSPDKRRIAFVSNRDGNFGIYLMDDRGGNIHLATSNDGAYYEYPAWSPDGRSLVYSSDEESDNFDLYILDLDSGQKRHLTTAEEDESSPNWSPDGRMIVYTQAIEGTYEIFVIDVAGGVPKRVVGGTGNEYVSPNWSPGGTQLAYAIISFDNTFTLSEIYVRDLNTGTERLLATIDDSLAGGVAWAPDSSEIAYTLRQSDGNWVIYVIDYNGNGTQILTNQEANAETPSWYATNSGTATSSPVSPSAGEIAINLSAQIAGLELSVPLRAQPTMNASIILNLPRASTVTIIGGPEKTFAETKLKADFKWWQVRTTDGVEGWVTETYFDEPTLIPLSILNPLTEVTCQLTTINGVNIRGGPGTDYEQIASRKSNVVLGADAQIRGDDGYTWWRLIDGYWLRDDSVREAGNCTELPAAEKSVD